MNDIPTFAVVGTPSEGKSTLIATLAEKQGVEVDEKAHTTRRRKPYVVKLSGMDAIRFIDTPGFEYSVKVLIRLKKLKEEHKLSKRSAIDAFYNESIKNHEFEFEVDLLEPLLKQDAAAIIVVNASRLFDDDETLEPMMEILSWTGQPRAIVINYHEGDEKDAEDVRRKAQRWAGIALKINAAKATWKERFDLLETLMLSLSLNADPARKTKIKKTLDALQRDWEARSVRSGELITELLVKCIQHSKTERIPADEDIQKRRAKIQDGLRKEIREMERKAHEAILREYGHVETRIGEETLEFGELFSKETLRTFGLTHWQLVRWGLVGGAALGGSIDLVMGAASLGVPTALAAIVGGLGAVVGYERVRIPVRVRVIPSLPDVTSFSIVSKVLSARSLNNIGTKALRKIELRVGPITEPNFAIVLHRRANCVHRHATRTAHGDRTDQSREIAMDDAIRVDNLKEDSEALISLCKALAGSREKAKVNAKGELLKLVCLQCKENSNQA